VYPNTRNVGVHVDPSQADALASYRMGRGFNEHQFCAVCGVPLLIRVRGPPPEMVAKMSDAGKQRVAELTQLVPVNLHVLNGVDLGPLQIEKTEGKSIPPLYVVN
jgi:hypothetical protein